MIVLWSAPRTRPAWPALARGVALGIVSRDYVTAAEALGESRLRVILAEVLPNMKRAPAGRGRAAAHLLDRPRRRRRLPGLRANPNAAEWGR
jgi:peptide/nickel transport system permease protein